MRALLILATYAVHSVIAYNENTINQDIETNEENIISANFGPFHVHTKIGDLPEKYMPLRQDDKHATQNTIDLLNLYISAPEINPFNHTFNFHNITIPDVEFVANLNIRNLVVTGIKDLAVNNIETRVSSPSRIDLNVSFPRITVEADFDLDGSYESFHISNSGHINVTLLDLEIIAAFGPVSTQPPDDMYRVYELESADVTINLKELHLRMNAKEFAKDVKLLLDQFLQYTEGFVIDNDLPNTVLSAINYELSEIPAELVEHYFLGT